MPIKRRVKLNNNLVENMKTTISGNKDFKVHISDYFRVYFWLLLETINTRTHTHKFVKNYIYIYRERLITKTHEISVHNSIKTSKLT